MDAVSILILLPVTCLNVQSAGDVATERVLGRLRTPFSKVTTVVVVVVVVWRIIFGWVLRYEKKKKPSFTFLFFILSLCQKYSTNKLIHLQKKNMIID